MGKLLVSVAEVPIILMAFHGREQLRLNVPCDMKLKYPGFFCVARGLCQGCRGFSAASGAYQLQIESERSSDLSRLTPPGKS